MLELTKQQVRGVVARRQRGMPRDQIAEETSLNKNTVSAVLTAEELSKTSAAKRRQYRRRVDRWLGEV